MSKSSTNKPHAKAKIKSNAPRAASRKPAAARVGRLPLVITALVALLVGVGMGVAVAPGGSDDGTVVLSAKDIRSIGEIRTFVDSHLNAIGATLPEGTFMAFPELQLSLDGFEKGKVKAGILGDYAEAASSAAKAKAAALNGLDLSVVAPDLKAAVSSDMFGALQDIVKALNIYRVSASLVAEAMSTDGEQQEFLLEQARTLRSIADGSMTDGFGVYSDMVSSAGLSSPTPIPGAPAGQVPIPPSQG